MLHEMRPPSSLLPSFPPSSASSPSPSLVLLLSLTNRAPCDVRLGVPERQLTFARRLRPRPQRPEKANSLPRSPAFILADLSPPLPSCCLSALSTCPQSALCDELPKPKRPKTRERERERSAICKFVARPRRPTQIQLTSSSPLPFVFRRRRGRHLVRTPHWRPPRQMGWRVFSTTSGAGGTCAPASAASDN